MIELTLEILAALAAAGGALLLGRFLFGRLLLPAGRDGAPFFAVIPASGGGEGLEHTVDGLLWLRSGHLARFTIVVADNGLNREGLEAARALSRRERDLIFCPMAELEQYIKETKQDGNLRTAERN